MGSIGSPCPDILPKTVRLAFVWTLRSIQTKLAVARPPHLSGSRLWPLKKLRRRARERQPNCFSISKHAGRRSGIQVSPQSRRSPSRREASSGYPLWPMRYFANRAKPAGMRNHSDEPARLDLGSAHTRLPADSFAMGRAFLPLPADLLGLRSRSSREARSLARRPARDSPYRKMRSMGRLGLRSGTRTFRDAEFPHAPSSGAGTGRSGLNGRRRGAWTSRRCPDFSARDATRAFTNRAKPRHAEKAGKPWSPGFSRGSSPKRKASMKVAQ